MRTAFRSLVFLAGLMVLLVGIILIATGLNAVGAQDGVNHGEMMFNIDPADVCHINGVPQVYGFNQGGYQYRTFWTLSYLATNGDIVMVEFQDNGLIAHHFYVDSIYHGRIAGVTCPQ